MTDTLDEALEAISRTAPEFANGNTNHAPMVAETLVAIGYGDMTLGWLDSYHRELNPQERPGERPALHGDWREGLGKPRLWSEWVSLFRREMDEMPWTDVLEAWVARLAPGLSGEALHGLIKTAHAARALGQRDTLPRRRELADALAYWASTYLAFDEVPSDNRHLGLEDAFARVPALETDTSGNIDSALRNLEHSREIAALVNVVAMGPDPLAALSKLTEHFAAIYLANAYDPARTFAVVHAVTGPSALRLIAPHISRSSLELLLLYAWQAGGAIYAVWGKDRDVAYADTEPASREDLIEASVTNGAAHAIKFVEACLREYEHNPSPVYLAAASDAARRLTG